MPSNDAFNDIKSKVKAIPTPLPNKITDIDTTNSLISNIVDSSDNNLLDLNTFSNFTTVSQRRDDIYNMIDIMAEDPIISTALDIYTSDVCEPNDQGQIMWVISDNTKCQAYIQSLLDDLNIDKNSYKWVHSFIKYGDLYLRLLHESEYNDPLFNLENNNSKSLNESLEKESVNEGVILNTYKNKDHIVNYLAMNKNPAEIFDLQKFDKSIGYIKTNIVSKNNTDDILKTSQFYNIYNFDTNDINIYPATSFVHASLEDNSTRTIEEVNISNSKDEKFTYEVKRGQSILYNIFRIWRELSLLENSVLLNRVTKSSRIRIVSTEVGDMEKNDVRTLIQRIKSMVEQKSALSLNNSYENYTNPGPIENTIYLPTHEGKGDVKIEEIGGEVESGDLKDLEYFRSKLFSAIGIPKQYLGFTEDSTGFNGGTSLSLISSQYAKQVKQIQNLYLQAITDVINIILLDKGRYEYLNNFTLLMQSPATQEEKDRRDNLATNVNNIREIMSLIGDVIEDNSVKLSILKSLLSTTINNQEVISLIQTELDKLEEETEEVETEDNLGEDSFDYNMEEPGDVEESEEPEENIGEEPADTEENEEDMNAFGESVEDNLLTDKDFLPNFEDLGINYNEINN